MAKRRIRVTKVKIDNGNWYVSYQLEGGTESKSSEGITGRYLPSQVAHIIKAGLHRAGFDCCNEVEIETLCAKAQEEAMEAAKTHVADTVTALIR